MWKIETKYGLTKLSTLYKFGKGTPKYRVYDNGEVLGYVKKTESYKGERWSYAHVSEPESWKGLYPKRLGAIEGLMMEDVKKTVAELAAGREAGKE